MLCGPHHALWATSSREPDIGPRFLHWQHPRVNHPVLVVLPFVAEGTRLCPAFDDQVMSLFEPFSVLGGVDSGLKSLNGPAPNEPRDDAAARVAIKHGYLFGHPDGVVDGDDVAEDRNLGFLSQFGYYCGIQVNRWFTAPVRGMVLVGHDAVETNFVSQGVLLVVLVI